MSTQPSRLASPQQVDDEQVTIGLSNVAFCGYCHSANLAVAAKVVAYWPVTGWGQDANGKWTALSTGGGDVNWCGDGELSGTHPEWSKFRCGDCRRYSSAEHILHGEDDKSLSAEVKAWATENLPSRYRFLVNVDERPAFCGVFNYGPTYRVMYLQRHILVPRYIENRLVLMSSVVPGSAAVQVKWVAPSTNAAPAVRTAFLAPVNGTFAIGTTALLAVAKAAAQTKALLRKQAKSGPISLPARIRARL